MPSRNSFYINDVDDLIAQTSVEQVLTYFGKPLPSNSAGEHRTTTQMFIERSNPKAVCRNSPISSISGADNCPIVSFPVDVTLNTPEEQDD